MSLPNLASQSLYSPQRYKNFGLQGWSCTSSVTLNPKYPPLLSIDLATAVVNFLGDLGIQGIPSNPSQRSCPAKSRFKSPLRNSANFLDAS